MPFKICVFMHMLTYWSQALHGCGRIAAAGMLLVEIHLKILSGTLECIAAL